MKSVRLYVIIWPPAMHYFEKIRVDLNKECNVINYQSLKVPKKTFEDFVYELYKLDHASNRKITGKLKRLQVNSNKIGVILVEIKKPLMIAHDCFNYVKCEDIGKIKFKLRNKYKSKIKDYIYDIIAHSTEADYQDLKVEELLEKYVINYENKIKVKYLREFLDFKFPTSEYIFVNSIWLTLMDIRINGDLDVLISNKLWDKKFSDKPKNLSFGLTSKFEKVRIHSIDTGPYMSTSFVISNDDLIYNNKIIIDGLPFIQPKLYFLYKLDKLKKIKKPY